MDFFAEYRKINNVHISKFTDFFKVEYLWGSVVKYQPSSAPQLNDIGNYATPLFFAIIFNAFLKYS
jgi:hypothetical protein